MVLENPFEYDLQKQEFFQDFLTKNSIYCFSGSVAKNLALLQNQQKPSQLGNLSTLIK